MEDTLASMAALADERGLAVFNITRMPVYNEPIMAPYVIIALNDSGTLRADLDFESYEFKEHDIILIGPEHVLIPRESDERYRATVLVMSRRLYGYLAEMYPDNYKYIHYYHKKFHLSDKQYEGMKSCFQQLHVLSTLDHSYRDRLLTSQLDIMAHLTEIYCGENGYLPDEKVGVELLLLRFHSAIAENYTKHRDVKFYADLLCLSPKYFGTVVRQSLGYSAGELISRYVMVQAKHLLRFHHKLTILQVSDRLGFSDQTAFSRYFKSHAGLTPQEYREGKQKN